MKTNLIHAKSQGMRVVKHWYLPLIAGLLCITGGVLIFIYPSESYLLLALVLGVIMIITGATEVVMAISSRNWFFTRAWNLIGATITILLGILLSANPAITIMIMPIIIGAWLLVRGIMMMGLSRDLSNMDIPGGGWIFACGLVIIILSLLILLRPFSIGISMVITLSGIGFIIGGISLEFIAFQAKNIHNLVKKYMPNEIEAEEI